MPSMNASSSARSRTPRTDAADVDAGGGVSAGRFGMSGRIEVAWAWSDVASRQIAGREMRGVIMGSGVNCPANHSRVRGAAAAPICAPYVGTAILASTARSGTPCREEFGYRRPSNLREVIVGWLVLEPDGKGRVYVAISRFPRRGVSAILLLRRFGFRSASIWSSPLRATELAGLICDSTGSSPFANLYPRFARARRAGRRVPFLDVFT